MFPFDYRKMCIKLVYTHTVHNQMYYPCDVYVISQENSTENIFCLESDNSEMKHKQLI